MALSLEDVKGIAEYARIELTDDELQEMCSYMNNAITMLRPILDIPLDDVDPTFHPIGELSNVMAPDDPANSSRALPIDEALRNAASAEGRNFRVPQILGDAGGDR